MAKDQKFNFAKAYQQLQTIVAWFEKEDVDLEEGIEKYQEGVKRANELKKYLDTIENKIRELKRGS